MSRRAKAFSLAAGVGLLVVGAVMLSFRSLYFYEAMTPVSESPRALGDEATEPSGELAAMRPRGLYLVVDTARNRLFLKRGEETLLEAVCSTGSGLRLRDVQGGREWVFDTPQGLFHISRKARDPVWTKPDWAFVEEGKPVPDAWGERRDPESLGDYALYFGDGFAIHGTLYQRYLGKNVTHGCVRLGDEDLEQVYRKTPVGTPVYIF